MMGSLVLLALSGCSLIWTPVVEMAHLASSMRTRSSLVSITIVLPVTNTTRPMMPPMVVMVSPFLTLSRISWACFFLLFSGRIRMK